VTSVPGEHVGEKRFMDGGLPGLQLGDYAFIVIDTNNVVADLGKARCRYQSNVTGTNDCNPHVVSLEIGTKPPLRKAKTTRISMRTSRVA
jgi:hypothetical protein